MKRMRAVVLLVAILVLAGLAARSCVTQDDAETKSPPPGTESREVASDEQAARHPERRRTSTSQGLPARDADSPPETAVDTDSGAAPVAGEVELHVTVRDSAGRRIHDVAVNVGSGARPDFPLLSSPPLLVPGSEKPPGSPDASPPPVRPITDGAGFVRITASREARLVVSAQSHEWIGAVHVEPGAEDGPTEVSLTVVPAFRLSGRVVFDDGQPVKDASIYVAAPLPGRARRMPRRFQVVGSDDEGRFRTDVHAVPATRIIECYVMANGVAGTSHRFPVTAGAHDEVELVVPRGTVIRGRCVNEKGEPLDGVRVRGIFPFSGEVTGSGRDGRFALPVPASGGGLIFFVEGRVQTALRDLRGPPEGTDIGDVLIPEGGTIAGRVVDEAGNALVGIEVLIVDPWSAHPAARPKTDAKGAFRSDVIGAGTHHAITACRRPDDPAGLNCYFRFDGLRAGDTEVTLTIPRGIWVEVVVHDFTNDEPLEFETGVFTLWRDDRPDVVPVHRVFETAGETRSAFMVQIPEPGAWSFELELPTSGRVDLKTITIPQAPREPIVITPR